MKVNLFFVSITSDNRIWSELSYVLKPNLELNETQLFSVSSI